jgi:hypothetical protein
VESLVEHRSSIEGAGSPCPADLLRFSVGLEDVGDLIGDTEKSLSAAGVGRRCGLGRPVYSAPFIVVDVRWKLSS